LHGTDVARGRGAYDARWGRSPCAIERYPRSPPLCHYPHKTIGILIVRSVHQTLHVHDIGVDLHALLTETAPAGPHRYLEAVGEPACTGGPEVPRSRPPVEQGSQNTPTSHTNWAQTNFPRGGVRITPHSCAKALTRARPLPPSAARSASLLLGKRSAPSRTAQMNSPPPRMSES